VSPVYRTQPTRDWVPDLAVAVSPVYRTQPTRDRVPDLGVAVSKRSGKCM